ncbi:MAG: hypothetical protein A2Z02_01720, partial [Chloroflexi bacterium RBG_16_48_7]
LTKRIIRDNGNDILCNAYPPKDRVRCTTSGSTLEPMAFYDTKENHVSISFGARQRVRSAHGVGLGTKCVFLSIRYQPDSIGTRISRGTIEGLNRTLRLYSSLIFRDGISKYAEKAYKFRPEVILGSPSPVGVLARYLQHNPGLTPRVHAVLVGGEQLTLQDRELFRNVFNCETYDSYGAEEQHTIAFQCREHDGYHIVAENTVVEIVDDANRLLPPGQPGRVLITNLHNYAMPLIRYDLGDIAVASDAQCRCGRGLPMLSSLLGREGEMIYTRSRGKIPGLYLWYECVKLLADRGIEQYQIVQEEAGEIVVEISAAKEGLRDPSSLERSLKNEFGKILGEDTGILLRQVEKIVIPEYAKRKFVVSLLKEKGSVSGL